MARFGRGMIQALTQPAYMGGLMQVAQNIGSAPARRAAQKEALTKYKDVAKVVSQGDVSAQRGDPRGISIAISRLEQRLENAKSVDEAIALQGQINKLRNKITTAEKIETTRNTDAVSIIDTELAKLNKEDDLFIALSKRKEELLKNPEVAENYRNVQTNRWRFETAQRNQKDAEWIRNNAVAIETAMLENDVDSLDSIIKNAGEHSQAAKAYVGIAKNSVDVRRKMQENSLEKTTAPDFEFYQEQIDSIPGSKTQLQPLLDRYKRVAKEAWNGKEWSQAGLLAAKRLEKTLQGQINSLLNTYNVQTFAANQQVATKEAEAVEEIVRDIEAPIKEEDVTREAQAIANKRAKRGKKGNITPEDRAEARQTVRSLRNGPLLETLYRLDEERAKDMGYVEPSKETPVESDMPTEIDTSSQSGGFFSQSKEEIQNDIRLLEGGQEKARENDEAGAYMLAFLKHGNVERARKKLEEAPAEETQESSSRSKRKTRQGRFIVEES